MSVTTSFAARIILSSLDCAIVGVVPIPSNRAPREPRDKTKTRYSLRSAIHWFIVICEAIIFEYNQSHHLDLIVGSFVGFVVPSNQVTAKLPCETV